MKKGLVIVLFAFGFVFGEPIVFEYTPLYPKGEMGPEYFGFPFIYRTDTTWVNSMSGEIYLKGLIGNLIFWIIVIWITSFGINKLKGAFGKAMRILIIIFGSLVCLVALTSMVIDWRFHFDHNDMKRDYFIDELEYNKELQLFWTK